MSLVVFKLVLKIGLAQYESLLDTDTALQLLYSKDSSSAARTKNCSLRGPQCDRKLWIDKK